MQRWTGAEARLRAGDMMCSTDSLYGAIEADDVDRIERLLTMRPSLVNSAEQAPPPIHWAIYQDKRRGRQRAAGPRRLSPSARRVQDAPPPDRPVRRDSLSCGLGQSHWLLNC